MSVSEKSVVDERPLDRRMGLFSAVMMPLVELGVIGFASYVFIYAMCIQYLMEPSANFRSRGINSRRAIAIGLIVGFCILLLFMLIAFLRLAQVIWTDPGVLPVGDRSVGKLETSSREFDRYDAFICDYEGNPLWCEKCHNWKPDRTHHCRELGRCTRRMDHFCPWAAGIIAETGHKFFIQFLFYAALFTTFTLIPLAVFLAERSRKLDSRPGIWVAAMALAALFCLFTGSMFFMSFWNVTINYTTIETLGRAGVHNIAFAVRSSTSPPASPRPSPRREGEDGPNVIREFTREGGHEYVVLQTQPFQHPWDMGSWENTRDVMGEKIIDWFIPLKMSPCVNHDDSRGEFGWSRAVLDLAADWQRDNPGRQVRLLRDRRGSTRRRTVSEK